MVLHYNEYQILDLNPIDIIYNNVRYIKIAHLSSNE